MWNPEVVTCAAVAVVVVVVVAAAAAAVAAVGPALDAAALSAYAAGKLRQ